MAEPVSIPIRTQANEITGELVLPEGLFDSAVKKHLIFETVRMQQANRRAGTASTKTRGSVSGGGKKPWRQKGTGRARAGSNRSPIWVGGATIFGPQPRDYSYKMPRSARRSALRSVLSMKLKEGNLIVLDKIELDAPKTKKVVSVLAGLNVTSALIIVAGTNLNLERGARNIPNVKVLRSEGANVYDILRYRSLIVSVDAIAVLKERVSA